LVSTASVFNSRWSLADGLAQTFVPGKRVEGTLIEAVVVGDLDPLAVAYAGLNLSSHRAAVLVLPAKRLPADVSQGGQQQRPDARPLDLYLILGPDVPGKSERAK
jgi:hypothetical protein